MRTASKVVTVVDVTGVSLLHAASDCANSAGKMLACDETKWPEAPDVVKALVLSCALKHEGSVWQPGIA